MSVMLRALRSSKPHVLRVAGRRFRVESALICPACGIVVIGPRIPIGWLTQVLLYALIRFRYSSTRATLVIFLARMAR